MEYAKTDLLSLPTDALHYEAGGGNPPGRRGSKETTSFSSGFFFFSQLTCDSNFESIKFSLTAEPLTLYIQGMESDL